VPPVRPATLAVVGGVLGPASFVGAWVVGGAIAEPYSPVDDAISRLAAAGASTRPLMTAGFLGFATGVGAYAVALRTVLPGAAWVAALGSAVTTAGVAAVPLDVGFDGLHGVLAGAGYATLVAVPALAARPLAREGRRRAAVAAVGVAAVGATALVASVALDDANGLCQRLGLTTVDLWLAEGAIGQLRQSSAGRRRR